MCSAIIKVKGCGVVIMWVVNPTKERTKQFIKSDIESSITNLTDVSNRLYDMISAINIAVLGTISGTDQRMIGDCQMVLQELSTALQNLYSCRNYADALDVMEWIDDDEC